MARGTTAKSEVQRKIAEAFGGDYIGEVDKKLYVWANDGGERVQIAISLTCPKNNIEIDGAAAAQPTNAFDFGEVPPKREPAKISEQEQQNIAELLKKLGL